MTRGKAALGGADEPSDLPKKALQSKKSTNALGTNGAKKRAALGDVSNVTKTEGLGAGAKGGKEDKKPLATKGGLVSKAAQPTGIKKPSRANSTRSVLGPKERNAPPKRPASGPGIGGHATKKRNTADRSSKSVKEEEEPEESENVPPVHHNVTTSVSVEAEIVKSNSVKLETIKSQVNIYEEEEPVHDEEVPDLDKEDADDPLMVSEYVVEIFEYLKQLEITTMANPDYMDNQTELEWKMRGILVDWLLEVHTRFRLLPETLFLAVNIIDRFLSAKVVQLDRLQLVGVTAMFIASKYEEVLSPHVQNFRHVADDGFTEEEILSAERFVLAALNYDLSYPNPMNFLRRISKADNYDIQTRTLGKYLLEIGCLDHRFLAYPPSQVAAAAMYLARLVLERGEWVSLS
jgi:G2/mitotic-specific cyclin 1/2